MDLRKVALVLSIMAITGVTLAATPRRTAARQDPPAPTLRQVVLSGEMYIKDDEITWDETGTYPLEKTFILSEAFPQYTYTFEQCEGGEVVGLLSILFMLEGDTVTGSGYAQLFEGTDCSTEDMEDSATIMPFVAGAGTPPLEWELENSGFGGGDKVEITLATSTSELPPAPDATNTPQLREVSVSGTMWIKDDEITWDETGTYDIQGEVVLSPQNREMTFEWEECEGGEVVGKLELTVQLGPDNVSVVVGGKSELFEGVSCGTDDREDDRDVAGFAVRPNETQSYFENLKSRGFGGGDEIEIDLVIANAGRVCGESALDSDCDGLSNEVETMLADRYRPLLVFDEDEPVDIHGEVATVYQVTPVVRENGKRGAMITYVFLYPRDEGPQRLDVSGLEDVLSCEAVVNTATFTTTGLLIPGGSFLASEIAEFTGIAAWYAAHDGDSEAMRVFVTAPNPDAGLDANWRIDSILMKRHFDDWEVSDDLSEFLFVPGDGTATPATASSGVTDEVHTHPVIYVSSSKHAMYTSKGQCEGYREQIKLFDLPTTCDIVFEKCDSEDPMDWVFVSVPASHNVGERYLHNFDGVAGSGSDDLTALYPYSAVWTDQRFCGGASSTTDIDLPGQHACAGAIHGKWWPPDDPVVDDVRFALGLQQSGGEKNYVIVDVTPLDPPPADGKGALEVIDTGGARASILPAGSDQEVTFSYGAAYFELAPGDYDIWSAGSLVGVATVEPGMKTTIELATGALQVNNYGGTRYGIYPEGTTDRELWFGFGDGRYGLATGFYDVWTMGEHVATVEINRGQETPITLDTGLLEVVNYGGTRYGIYPTGSTDRELWFGFGNGIYGLLSGTYDIWKDGALVATVTVTSGQTTVQDLN